MSTTSSGRDGGGNDGVGAAGAVDTSTVEAVKAPGDDPRAATGAEATGVKATGAEVSGVGATGGVRALEGLEKTGFTILEKSHGTRPWTGAPCLGRVYRQWTSSCWFFFEVINGSGFYDEPTPDHQVTRKAKILYVSLLESVQKERGEWQGFSSSPATANDDHRHEKADGPSSRDWLRSNHCTTDATEQLGVLTQLLEVSCRNLPSPLVPLERYTECTGLLHESLAVPPALTTLSAIREMLNLLERQVRHCLLRLFALWEVMALVSGQSQPLFQTIAEKHSYVFRDSSELKNMVRCLFPYKKGEAVHPDQRCTSAFPTKPARKRGRQDSVAIPLLQLMVLYRDLLFSDLERARPPKTVITNKVSRRYSRTPRQFIVTKQELQVNSHILEAMRRRAWSSAMESAPVWEEGDRSLSDSDRSSDGEEENEMVRYEASNGLEWAQSTTLDSSTLLPRTSSSATCLVEEDEQRSLEGKWSISSPTSQRDRHSRDQRSRMPSRDVLGGEDSLAPVLKLDTSPEGISSPAYGGYSRRIKRIPSQSSQQSVSSCTNAPTHSITSQAHASPGSCSRTRAQRRCSLTDSNHSSGSQRNEVRVQGTNKSASGSLPWISRSILHPTKRMRGKKRLSGRFRPRSRLAAGQGRKGNMYHGSKQGSQDTHRPSYFSMLTSYLATPVAATTLGVLASLAIFKMRNAFHN
ncbi:hypothetical protein PsorP6_005499 [Peronosclerospora sorghi]|uniref:Uncharacterized protein n=1 Tax=Peronosclerospora sorghi TaxID=230839 RepID=A0ACC0W2M9_9STRA|nr:hypothetical protein PsorP6_005499 [Peronosclerospora sorghi]